MKIKNPKTPVSKIVIFLMLLASMIFISCENSLMPRDESEAANQFKNEKDERAYIVFSLKNNGAVSKNIVSDFSRFSFTNVEFSGTCGSKTVSKTAETFEGLAGQQIFVDVGNWNFTLTADYGTEKYKATKTVSIHSGANSIEMKLEADTSASGGVAYNPAEHPGSYEITLKFPSDNIDVVKFEIKKMDDTIVHSEDKIKGTDYSGSGMKTIVYSADSFDPGFYIIHFGFKSLKGKDSDGNDIYEQINDWGDILTINPGALSKGTLTLPKSEPVYSISYNLNGGSWKSTYDGNFYFSYTAKTKETDLSGVEHNYLTLPTRTALQRDGYRFLGWFESSDFSGEEVTQLNVSAKQNKTYYAKWEEFTGFALSFEVVNNEGETFPITRTQALNYGLPVSFDPEETTDTVLPEAPLNDGEGEDFTCTYSYNSSFSTELSGKTIAAGSITEDKTIYIKPQCTHVYVDPATGNDNYLAFDVATPAASVAEAKKWLQTSGTHIIYAKSTISAAADIAALSGTESPSYYVYLNRHSSLINAPVVKIESGTAEINYAYFDGGANWGSLSSSASVYGVTNTGIKAKAPFIEVASGASLTINYVNVINNDNTQSSGGGIFTYGSLSCAGQTNIKSNRAANGGGIYVGESGSLTWTSSWNLSYNAATNNGGGIYISENSGVVSINSISIKYNKAKECGGAVYIDKTNSEIKMNGGEFMYNELASATGKGTNIYVDGGTSDHNLHFYLNIPKFMDGDIYTTVAKPIVVSGMPKDGAPEHCTIVPAAYYSGSGNNIQFNKQILEYQDLAVTQYSLVKDYFQLPDSDYIIDDEGYIKPAPHLTVVVTPNFPEAYSCTYIYDTRTRNVEIKLKDPFGNEVPADLINSLKVTLYETDEKLAEWVGSSSNGFAGALNFTYPAFLEVPTSSCFYVEVSIKPEVTSSVAYYYDFWPSKESYIGSIIPNSELIVGDIIFTDGSIEHYTNALQLTDEQKADAVAIIFYKGNGLNSGSDTSTRTLGVGLKQSSTSLIWCVDSADALNKKISTILCTVEDEGDGEYTITGDKNGSDNFEQLAEFSGVGDTNSSANYPAFYWAKNYKDTATNLSGTEFEDEWYMPSIAEIYELFKCQKDTVNGFDVEAALTLCEGTVFYSSVDGYNNSKYYLTSSQHSDSSLDDYCYEISVDYHSSVEGNVSISFKYKGSSANILVIREF